MRLPVRDMRLVDPNLLTSETGKILVRDNGIVVSIEHVRLIIMAEQVRETCSMQSSFWPSRNYMQGTWPIYELHLAVFHVPASDSAANKVCL